MQLTLGLAYQACGHVCVCTIKS